ncbi:MAG: glycoside hydrolase family 140 protein [Limisphaerales bacterium]
MRKIALLICVSAVIVSAVAAPKLRVSENKRFLVTANGKPFFYLGDTAWELFHRLNREQADKYLEDRAKKGFTVIQAVALAELNGLNDPNPYGHRPLLDSDPSRPDVKEGPQNDYWDHVDYIVNSAEELGLTIGFLPTWGDKWNPKWAKESKVIFTQQNAEKYGQWLAARYRDKPIIWILGGDRPVENEEHKQITRAMAGGLRAGDGGIHLMTFHPPGGNGSSQWFHGEEWLDFNMRQNGHVTEFNARYSQTKADYDKAPTKPVIDAEPIYEDHPISFNAKEFGHSIAADVRRPLYWNLFSGAFGHTYGHHSVWQMYSEGKTPINAPLMPWHEAIDQPGAAQMQFGRKLIESRPFLTRVPDDNVIVTGKVATSIPGAGQKRLVATRDLAGTYAMIYTPVGRKFSVNMDVIKGGKVKAWWFNPRTGKAEAIGQFENKGTREFNPPNPGEMLDWVLVLDDAQKDYPAPGSKSLL